MTQIDNQDYVQLQLLNQKLAELDEAIGASQQQLEHALIATQTLESLESAKKDQELLVPLGAGAFLEVKAQDVQNVKLVVGANVVVDKSVKDTIQSIKSQIQELHQFQERSVQLYHQVVDKINSLQEDIESKLKGV